MIVDDIRRIVAEGACVTSVRTTPADIERAVAEMTRTALKPLEAADGVCEGAA